MRSTETDTEGCFKYFFDELEDAAVKFELVDGEPIIIEANDAFTDVFADASTSVIGEPLNDLIVPPSKQQEAKQFDQRTKMGQPNAAIVERKTDRGNRKFLYRGVPYKDRYGFAIYADITDEMRRKRHLDVLHRVLRHNLRNDLSVVLGIATQIIEQTDEEQTRQAAKEIEQKASELAQLSEEAKTIRSVLGETASVKAINLNTICDDVVATCESRFETASITAEIPTGLAVSANEKLHIVLRSLLDNAIRHNDSAQPRATVSATELDSGTVEIEVTDNGPGIPAAEQRIITGDGQITPVNHGSGLGLWVVKWVIDSYGGTLDIETPTSGGSTVRIRLNRYESE